VVVGRHCYSPFQEKTDLRALRNEKGEGEGRKATAEVMGAAQYFVAAIPKKASTVM